MYTVMEYLDSDRGKLLQALMRWRNEDFAFWKSEEIADACQIPGTALVLLVCPEGEWAGMALARRMDRAIELFYIYVTPGRRGMGLSRIMLDHLFFHFAGQADEMFLEVRASNRAAQQSYKKYGFIQLSRRPNYYADGEDAVIMRMSCKEQINECGKR